MTIDDRGLAKLRFPRISSSMRVHFILAFWVGALFFPNACSKGPAEVSQGHLIEDDGKAYLFGERKPYTGTIVERHPNGAKGFEASYVDGVMSKHVTEWHDNGQKRYEANLSEGKPGGMVTGWHRNGEKAFEVHWENGAPNGFQTEWHEDGKLKAKYPYRNGSREGLATGWDENGNKAWEANWENDAQHGSYKEFHLDGSKRLEVAFVNGKRKGEAIQWYPSGKIGWQGAWDGDHREGEQTEFFENGTIKGKEFYFEGKLQLALIYATNGVKIVEKQYRDGQLFQQIKWDEAGKQTDPIPKPIDPKETTKPDPTLPPLKPNPESAGRKHVWSADQIVNMYKGKPLASLKLTFGDPDEVKGAVWIYRGLKIQDAKASKVVTRAHFVISDEKILVVEVVD